MYENSKTGLGEKHKKTLNIYDKTRVLNSRCCDDVSTNQVLFGCVVKRS